MWKAYAFFFAFITVCLSKVAIDALTYASLVLYLR